MTITLKEVLSITSKQLKQPHLCSFSFELGTGLYIKRGFDKWISNRKLEYFPFNNGIKLISQLTLEGITRTLLATQVH